MTPRQPAGAARLSGVFPGLSAPGTILSVRLGLFSRLLPVPLMFVAMLFVAVVLMELVGDVVLGLHQVLLEFLLGIPAPTCGVPQFTR